MIAKTVEIRDRATFIPALAVKLSPDSEKDRYLLARAGYGVTPEAQAKYVLLIQINAGNGKAVADPYDWVGWGRTYQVVHHYLIEHFDELSSGAVLDVEFILGESESPAVSEAEHPLFGSDPKPND